MCGRARESLCRRSGEIESERNWGLILLVIGPNYHITVMFDPYNMGQQSDMKFYADIEHVVVLSSC